MGTGRLPVNADGCELLPNVLVDAEGWALPTKAVHPVYPLAHRSHTQVVSSAGDRNQWGQGLRPHLASLGPSSTQPAGPACYLAARHVQHKLVPRDLLASCGLLGSAGRT